MKKKKSVNAIKGSVLIGPPLNLHDDGLGNLLNKKGKVIGKIDYKKISISFNDDENRGNLLPS